MIPARWKADFWIQIIARDDEQRDAAIDMLQLIARVTDAIMYSQEEATDVDATSVFSAVIIVGELEKVGVFAAHSIDDQVDVKHPYANGYILLDESRSRYVDYRPSRRFSSARFDAEARQRWPHFGAAADAAAAAVTAGTRTIDDEEDDPYDALRALTLRDTFCTRYGVTREDWHEALAGNTASTFVVDGEMVDSPLHLIYEIVADAESRSLRSLAARRAVAFDRLWNSERIPASVSEQLLNSRRRLHEH